MKSIGIAVAFVSLASLPSFALPTMIRLGYPNCASCHVSPQGGGTLNDYGRSIDEAQSFRAGNYEPAKPSVLNLGGRFDQDVRVVLSDAITRVAGGEITTAFRARFYYRTVAHVGRGLRFTAVAGAENEPSPRRALLYDPAVVPQQTFITTALMQYRPKEGVELAVGRDQLPSGVYTGDLATLFKSRNRFGYYDNPLQAKLFLWGKRWQAIPYAFAPRETGADPIRERGGGLLAEYDVLGNGRTVVGTNLLRGSDPLSRRFMTGIYTRLGFGRWGILAEQDFTHRHLLGTAATSMGQRASYVQGFVAFREWLVGSAIYERLSVDAPFPEQLSVERLEISARWSPNFTTGLRTGVQYDHRTGRASPVITVQLAWKTVGLKPW